MTVYRVKHQKNYVVISKEVLENPNISFKAKGLWAYCMSRPDDWVFNITHLSKISQDKKESVYAAIKELENEGYITKSQQRKRGKFYLVDYEIHETKIVSNEIKEILPQRQKPDTGKPDTGNPPLLSNDLNQVMKETNKYCPESATLSSSVEEGLIGTLKSKSKYSQGALSAANFLNNELNKLYPNRKQPKIGQWAYEMDLLNRIDKRDWKDVHDVIEWALEHVFWAKNILSPLKLRKQWETLMAQKNPPQNKGNRIHWNKVEAREAESHLRSKRDGRADKMKIWETRVEKTDTKECIMFDLPCKEFVFKLCEMFNIKKA